MKKESKTCQNNEKKKKKKNLLKKYKNETDIRVILNLHVENPDWSQIRERILNNWWMRECQIGNEKQKQNLASPMKRKMKIA